MNPESHRRYQHERELDVLRAAQRVQHDSARRPRRLTRLASFVRTEAPAPDRPAVSES